MRFFFSGHCDLDLWPKVTNFNRVWTNAKSNCLVKTPSNSVYRFDQHFVHKFRHVSGYCDLDLWPKVTKFNRVRASARSNHLTKTASKSVHLFGWNFVHKKCRTHRHTDTHTHTHTHTHTDTQTNWSENITPPRFRGGVKNLFGWIVFTERSYRYTRARHKKCFHITSFSYNIDLDQLKMNVFLGIQLEVIVQIRVKKSFIYKLSLLPKSGI